MLKLNEKIRLLRCERGMTQTELGDKVGVSRQTVAMWECGRFGPAARHVFKLANALSVSVDSLLEGEE